ncbi:MAG: hypothetical protein HYY87_02490 [Candidatus Levybacteria bacterium]|nr:hypothetical protein [Candidatus Levybacteria bacterium]MBI3070149.1 hypothetical protein [Candidatus Levybacteria bacterium]
MSTIKIDKMSTPGWICIDALRLRSGQACGFLSFLRPACAGRLKNKVIDNTS